VSKTRTSYLLSIGLSLAVGAVCLTGILWFGWLVVVFIAQSMTRMLGGT
jgi:hypothetical protein